MIGLADAVIPLSLTTTEVSDHFKITLVLVVGIAMIAVAFAIVWSGRYNPQHLVGIILGIALIVTIGAYAMVPATSQDTLGAIGAGIASALATSLVYSFTTGKDTPPFPIPIHAAQAPAPAPTPPPAPGPDAPIPDTSPPVIVYDAPPVISSLPLDDDDSGDAVSAPTEFVGVPAALLGGSDHA